MWLAARCACAGATAARGSRPSTCRSSSTASTRWMRRGRRPAAADSAFRSSGPLSSGTAGRCRRTTKGAPCSMSSCRCRFQRTPRRRRAEFHGISPHLKRYGHCLSACGPRLLQEDLREGHLYSPHCHPDRVRSVGRSRRRSGSGKRRPLLPTVLLPAVLLRLVLVRLVRLSPVLLVSVLGGRLRLRTL